MDAEYQRRRALTFGEAEGLKELPRQLTRETITPRMRALLAALIQSLIQNSTDYSHISESIDLIFKSAHINYFHQMPIEYTSRKSDLIEFYSAYLENCGWDEYYSLIEFFIRCKGIRPNFIKSCAFILEDNHSMYRIVNNDTLVPLASETDAATVRTALEITARDFAGARHHLISAAQHLTAGNWADSVRDSIHAVESVARALGGGDSLGKALALIDKRTPMNGAFKTALQSLYGYTCQEEGIRHALVEGPSPVVDEHDALFMYAACSAFVTYLVKKGNLDKA